MEEYEQENNGCLGIFLTIVFIGIIIWLGKNEYDNYRFGEKEPFWTGTKLVRVCKTPYYSTSECYKLDVTLINNKTARINFKNGGNITTHDLTCYFTTDYKYRKETRYVFCRSWDENDQQWDFLPMLLTY